MITTDVPSYRKIISFWLPLAATWLMMSVEGPFLAAVIARLNDPKFNLAAYGVAYSFALIIEAPVIMMMSASTALVKDFQPFKKLRNFTFYLSGFITLFMIIIVIPDIFYFITIDLIALPENVARITYYSTLILLPWPGAIGYRRFYQGILIRNKLTRRVAYGTIIRLLAMSLTAMYLYWGEAIPGAYVGAAALSAGVVLEALASRLMVHNILKKIISKSEPDDKPVQYLSYRSISKFYYPLALTSILGLGVHPMVTFFVGQSRHSIESLAVLPVINSLVFIFRSVGLSYQEAGIALMDGSAETYQRVRNFAIILFAAVITLLGIIAYSPLAELWYREVSGLSAVLTGFAIIPTQILAIMPGLTVILSFQRAILVYSEKTTPITGATMTEVLSIICVLFILIKFCDFIGATAVAVALLTGRLGANLVLIQPFRMATGKLFKRT
ncbi:MAG: hypothetical protein AB7W47_05105 [Calditrichaceae bacterium]